MLRLRKRNKKKHWRNIKISTRLPNLMRKRLIGELRLLNSKVRFIPVTSSLKFKQPHLLKKRQRQKQQKKKLERHKFWLNKKRKRLITMLREDNQHSNKK